MLSMHEQKSVQYLVNHAGEEEVDYLKERAESEIEVINTASRCRTMTPVEVRAYDFATEVLKQLVIKQFDNTLSFSLHQQNVRHPH